MKHKFISRSRHPSKPVYRQNDVVLVEEGATFAIGLPPERCHLFREDGSACRRLHQEPGV